MEVGVGNLDERVGSQANAANGRRCWRIMARYSTESVCSHAA